MSFSPALPFLRLGTIAFGGPAAHIAMMEEEFVRRRGWLAHADFLDMLGAYNLIPGPSSTEMAIHIGHQRGGWKGIIAAGTCFILPAMLMVMACAWVYAAFGSADEGRCLNCSSAVPGPSRSPAIIDNPRFIDARKIWQ